MASTLARLLAAGDLIAIAPQVLAECMHVAFCIRFPGKAVQADQTCCRSARPIVKLVRGNFLAACRCGREPFDKEMKARGATAS